MIRKTGFAVIATLAFGLIESVILGYSYAILFFFLVIACVTADIVIFNLTTAAYLLEVSVRRDVKKPYTRKGEFVEVVLQFTNNSRRLVDFGYFDTLSSVFETKGEVKGEIRLEAGQTASKYYQISATAIGKYNVGPIIMYADDALHLALATYTLTADSEIRVAPSNADILSRRSDRASNMIYTWALHVSRKAGQGYNFYGIREYSENDDFRYVAWSRLGIRDGDDIYIKQMEEERQIEVNFVIDYSVAMNQGDGKKLIFDTIISEIISMSHGILKNHDGVGFMLVSSVHDIYIKAEKNTKVVDKFEKAVSEIKPDGDFSVQKAFDNIKKRIKKQAIVFLVTPFSFPEKFSLAKSSVPLVGKKLNMIILSRTGFIKMPEDDINKRLMSATLAKENRAIKAISTFFNSIGVRSFIANERNFVSYVMMEYASGKATL